MRARVSARRRFQHTLQKVTFRFDKRKCKSWMTREGKFMELHNLELKLTQKAKQEGKFCTSFMCLSHLYPVS